MYKILLPLIFSTFLYAEPLNGVSVMVKGDIITLYDVKEEMRLSGVNSAVATDNLIRKKLEAAEIQERKITVSSSEVYEDIKKVASANKMSVEDLYETARNSGGLSSTEFKEKTKEKLVSQKLYLAIAYSSVDMPKEDEIKEYYELYKEDFSRPSAFSVTIYGSQNRSSLEKKITTPMYNSNEVKITDQTLPYDKISPELAKILQNTKNAPLSLRSKVSTSSENVFETPWFDSVIIFYVNFIIALKRECLIHYLPIFSNFSVYDDAFDNSI